MRLFNFKGGVHPDDHKEPTADLPVTTLPLPERLYVPMQQHIGAPARPSVKIGQRVLKGEVIGQPAAGLSVPVHAPTSGTVLAVDDVTAPHPSGLATLAVVIAPDGEERWCDLVVPIDPFRMEPEAIAAKVGAAGVVGMGGAAFPSAVKLNLGQSRRIHTLVMNGAECEPYLTADDRLMRERADGVIDGVRIMLHALGANAARIAIEDNKPAAQTAMRRAAERYPEVGVVGVPTRYPMGSEKQMIQTVTGLEVPAGRLSAEIGVLVHNVATAFAVHQAVRFGRPLLSRIVTVSGGALVRPANLEVPFGTRVADLVEHCGGYREAPARLLLGGPMMGIALPHSDVPLVKGSNGVLALSPAELAGEKPAHPCIRCGRCAGACPLGLLPLEIAARIRAGKPDAAMEVGLGDCIGCGTCAYVCPAHIPLTQYFSFAKGELGARREAKKKAEHTKVLAKARQERLEREKQEKKAKMAARKRAAAKKAVAEGNE